MKNFNLSDIMIRAWVLYHTLTGDHRAKLSQALRMAWAEFKNPEPVQPAAPVFDEHEIIEIRYPEGKMTVPMEFLIYRSKSNRETKKLLKMCEVSDRNFKTDILNNWIKGLRYVSYESEKCRAIAYGANDEKNFKFYDREIKRCAAMQEVINALTA